MKLLLKLLAVFILLFSFPKVAYALSCNSGFSGTIQDSFGSPISGVNITVFGNGSPTPSVHTSTSRSDGTFSFPYEAIGNITISATKSGYLPITSTVLLCQNNIFVMNIDAAPTSSPGREPRCNTTCATSTQCEQATDGCTFCYRGVCIDPERIPSPPPNPNAIDFNQLGNAVPGLKPIFTQGASGVMPILSDVINYLFVIAGLLLLFYLIYGGFHMIVAAKDEKALVEAKGKITNALVGFLILFLSFWVIQIMQYVLGVDFGF